MNERPALEVRGLTKTFGGTVALRDVSLSFAQGSVTAIVGENGSGKSTLLRVIAGLIRPDRGRVLLNGREASVFRPHARFWGPRGMAAGFQIPRFLSGVSLADNVVVGSRPGSSRSLILACLAWGRHIRELQMDRREARQNVVAETDRSPEARPTELSFGQLRRLELLRIRTGLPGVVLLDEPSAGLDASARVAVSDWVAKARRDGQTVLVVEHDLEFVRRVADRYLELRRGRVVADHEHVGLALDGRGSISGPASETRAPSPCADREILLRCEDLSAGYGLDAVFRDFSMLGRAGQTVAFTGPNGSGKSTALRALGGLVPWTRGRALVTGPAGQGGDDGARLLGRSGGMSLALQGGAVFPGMSVEENLRVATHRLPSPGEREEGIRRAVQAFPDLARLRRTRAGALSGGQRQALSLAQAIANEPRVLLVDEPSTGLTGMNYHLMVAMLRAVTGAGGLVVMVEHNRELVDRLADEEWAFSFGQQPRLVRARG